MPFARRTALGAAMTIGVLVGMLGVVAPRAGAEQGSSATHRVAAARLAAGGPHTCAILDGGTVRCWGSGGNGQLGTGSEADVGDNETPAAVGPVNLGAGRTARAVAAGVSHTCAILDNRTLRCWGENLTGQLGYANSNEIGDDETPGSVGPVDLGAGRTARAIAAGAYHTCAILDNGAVRCWGNNQFGQLGYGHTAAIGVDETPGSVDPVNLGAGRTAVAISAGTNHTCAVLDNGAVRCWGAGTGGQLGYGDTADIGDDETPASAGPVNLGAGRTAVAVAAGEIHTCAILDNGAVRCWGWGASGRLGYANTTDIGDDECPAVAGPIQLGAGRTAVAITAGAAHTCAILDNGSLRCWGDGGSGRLGYASSAKIGDNETPVAPGTVNLGAGRTAVAVDAGAFHTCAVLDDGRVRCWGAGANGRLGGGNTDDIGDNETPAAIQPVDAGNGAVSSRATTTLFLAATPARDTTSPYTFTLTGIASGAFIRDKATCTGSVVLRLKQGTSTRVSKTTALKLTGTSCTYTAALAITTKGTYAATATYGGGTNLRPATAPARTVRAG